MNNEDTRFDNMMRESLAPNFMPSDELNNKILSAKPTKKKATVSVIPKIIAAAAGVLIVGSLSVYAGTRIYKKVFVTDHAISVGNTEYVIDEAIATMDINEPQSPGYSTVDQEYDTYAEAVEATGLGYHFHTEYEVKYKVYTSVTTGPDIVYRDLNTTLLYNDGEFDVSYSVAEGNIAEDAAYSVRLENTSNRRDYVTAYGAEFSLVDETKNGMTKTYVLVCYDNVTGYLAFYNLSDDEIHEVLESLEINLKPE